MKKHIKKITVFLSIALICFLSCVPKYYIYASGSSDPTNPDWMPMEDKIAQDLSNFWNSCTGAVKKGMEIMPLPHEVIDSVAAKFKELWESGDITKDSDGNYQLSPSAVTQINNIYNNYQFGDNFGARYVSDFTDFSFLMDGYVNQTYITQVSEAITYMQEKYPNSDFLYYTVRFMHPDSYYGNTICTNFNIIAMDYTESNGKDYHMGGIYTSYASYEGYNSYSQGLLGTDGSTHNWPTRQVACWYRGYFANNNSPRDTSGAGISCWNNNGGSSGGSLFVNGNYLGDWYNEFPNLVKGNYTNEQMRIHYSSDSLYRLQFYCTRPFGVSTNLNQLLQLTRQSDGIFYTPQNITTINYKSLTENNWTNIYNNYVNNVKIDYGKDPSMTADQFRKIQKKYTNAIIKALESSTENLEETLSVSNNYLQSISVNSDSILELLQEWYLKSQNGDGSGGGLTLEQYNTLIAAINQIQLNTDPSNYQIEQILRYLNSIDVDVEDVTEISETLNGLTDGKEQYLNYLTYLAATNSVVRDLATDVQDIALDLNEIKGKIGKNGGGNTITAPPKIGDDLIQQLLDLAEGEIDEQVATLAIIGDVVQMCVPFCYLAVFGGILEAFAVEPETPEFEFEVSGGILSQTEDGKLTTTIDLSWVDPIRPYFIALEEIAFIVALMSLSFRVFRTFGALFS